MDISPVSVVEKIWDGKIPDVKPPVRKKLDNFVEPLRILKKRAMDVSATKSPSLRSDILKLMILVLQGRNSGRPHTSFTRPREI